MKAAPRPQIHGESEPTGIAVKRTAEGIVLAMACLAPWAFGSVDAWAILALEVGTLIVALLVHLDAARAGRRGPSATAPAAALAALTGLALVQAAPLSPAALRTLAPSAFASLEDAAPGAPEKLEGDVLPPVRLPDWTLSVAPGETLHAASQLLACLVLFQSVLDLGGGYAALRRFGLATCLNATAMAAFAMIQALSWNGKIFWIRPSLGGGAWGGGGPFVCHNQLAEYLNLGIGFALGAILGGRAADRRGRGGLGWPAFALGILIVGLLVSCSRGGVVGIATATAVGLLASRRLLSRTTGIGLASVAAVVVALLVAIGGASGYGERLATFFRPPAEDVSVAWRLDLWKASLRAWEDHPIWGVGLGAFSQGTTPYLDRDVARVFTRAENEVVDLLAEGGAIGLGLGLIALVAVVIRGRQALITAPTDKERALVTGAVIGGTAVMIQMLFDFGLHIPGVGFSVIVLAARLSRLGIDGAYEVEPSAAPRRRPRAAHASVAVATVLAMAPVLAHQWSQTRGELELQGSGVPMPGAMRPSADEWDEGAEDLDRKRRALERCLVWMPDWCDGHLWLGKTYLGLYQLAEDRRTGGPGLSTGDVPPEADPLWLVYTAGEGNEALPPAGPSRDLLVKAARSFQEARRCWPSSGLAQAKLASLAFLFETGDPPEAYAERALARNGCDEQVCDFVAEVAARLDDADLAARAWRKCLDLKPDATPLIADSAARLLPPERILKEVAPGARSALFFAERIYNRPEDQEIRDRFFQATLDRLPRESESTLASGHGSRPGPGPGSAVATSPVARCRPAWPPRRRVRNAARNTSGGCWPGTIRTRPIVRPSSARR